MVTSGQDCQHKQIIYFKRGFSNLKYVTINKWGHESEKEQGGTHGRGWRDEREKWKWCDYVLI